MASSLNRWLFAAMWTCSAAIGDEFRHIYASDDFTTAGATPQERYKAEKAYSKRRLEEAKAKEKARFKEEQELMQLRPQITQGTRDPRARQQRRTPAERPVPVDRRKEQAEASWRTSKEARDKLAESEKKRQSLFLDGRGRAFLKHALGGPHVCHAGGFARVGSAPSNLMQKLQEFWRSNRGRAFLDEFAPILGPSPSKILPLPENFLGKNGLVDQAISPIVQKNCQQKLEFANVLGIRVYHSGSEVQEHVDSLERTVTVALPVTVVGAASGWHLYVSPHPNHWRPTPLGTGQLLLYEGSWLPHSRRIPLKAGILAMLFVEYRPVGQEGRLLERKVRDYLQSRGFRREKDALSNLGSTTTSTTLVLQPSAKQNEPQRSGSSHPGHTRRLMEEL